MAKFKSAQFEFEARDNAQAGQVSGSIKVLLDKVAPEDLIKIATKVNKDPNIVKTALKWI